MPHPPSLALSASLLQGAYALRQLMPVDATGPSTIQRDSKREAPPSMAPSLIRHGFAATASGKNRYIYLSPSAPQVDDVTLEARYLTIQSLQSKLANHLQKGSNKNIAAERFAKGHLEIAFVDSETFTALAASAKQVAGSPATRPVFIDLSTNRLICDMKRCFEKTTDHITNEAAHGLTAAIANPSLHDQARETARYLPAPTTPGTNKAEYLRQAESTQDKFKKSMASVVRKALFEPDVALSRTASSMSYQIGEADIVKAYLHPSPLHVKRAAVAFSVAKANEQIQQMLRGHIPKNFDGLKEVKSFNYLGLQDFRAAMNRIGMQGDPIGLTYFDEQDKPHLYINLGATPYDATVAPHELLHIHEDFETLDLFTKPEFRKLVSKFPNLRHLSVPHLLDEGTITALTDRLTGGRHSLAGPPEYRRWSVIIKNMLEKYGDKELFAVLFKSGKFSNKPQERLMALQNILGKISETIGRHDEL